MTFSNSRTAHRPHPGLRLVRNQRERGYRAQDLVTFDHLPACPDCGDLAHPGATVCEACAAPLFPKQSKEPNRTRARDAQSGSPMKGV